MSSTSLTAAQRTVLLGINQADRLSAQAQRRLSTGNRVNSVVDDAVAFFRARSLRDSATDSINRQDDIALGISQLNVALQGIETVDQLTRQLRGVVQAARTASAAERLSANAQFSSIIVQIGEVIQDSALEGVNLLENTANSLTINLSNRTASRIVVNGLNLNATAIPNATNLSVALFSIAAFNAQNSLGRISNFGISGGTFTTVGAANSNLAFLDTATTIIDNAISRIRGAAQNFGVSVALVNTRQDFNNNLANILNEGADSLVIADLNEESAILVAAQTRQQLGIQALSISGQQQRSIIDIFRGSGSR